MGSGVGRRLSVYGSGGQIQAERLWAVRHARQRVAVGAESYGKDYYEKSPGQDPQGPDDSDDCVIRGGSFDDEAKDCRAAYRNRAEVSDWDVDLGFRVVCVP